MKNNLLSALLKTETQFVYNSTHIVVSSKTHNNKPQWKAFQGIELYARVCSQIGKRVVG